MSASTNLTSIAYNKETSFGEVNAAPEFTVLPTTGGSPSNNVSTATSEVIREDRQTDDLVVVDGEVTGELNYELSYAPYKDFLASVLMNSSSKGPVSITAASVNGTGAGDEISKASIGDDVKKGDVIRLSSISDNTINGEYVCTISTTGTITVYPPTGATADESDIEVVYTEVRTNSNSAIEGYTIRKTAINESTPYYWYYVGCAINSMNFNFATGSILNGSVGIVGLTEDARTTQLDGEVADIPTPAYSIMNSVTSVGLINIEGVTLGSCSFSSLDLTIDNQINAAKGIGVLGACDLAAYSVQITGNTEVYFSDLDLYNKFLNAESFSVTIILTDVDGNTIGINMPKCKFESLDTPISGKDAFLMQSGSFKALRDQTEDYMIKFTRIDA